MNELLHTAVPVEQTLKNIEWELRIMKISWHTVFVNLCKAICACFSDGNATPLKDSVQNKQTDSNTTFDIWTQNVFSQQRKGKKKVKQWNQFARKYLHRCWSISWKILKFSNRKMLVVVFYSRAKFYKKIAWRFTIDNVKRKVHTRYFKHSIQYFY